MNSKKRLIILSVFFILSSIIFVLNFAAAAENEAVGLPDDGSCFWTQEKVNGRFYFFFYSEGKWYFSNDMIVMDPNSKTLEQCPIKIWPESAAKSVLETAWHNGEFKGTGGDKSAIVRNSYCSCYDEILEGQEIASTKTAMKKIISDPETMSSLGVFGGKIFLGQEVEYYKIKYPVLATGKILTKESITGLEEGLGITFVGNEPVLDVSSSIFKDIYWYKKLIHDSSQGIDPSYIFFDKEGNIIRADFVAKSKGGIYNFNGQEFKVPANTRVIFDTRIREDNKDTEPSSDVEIIMPASGTDLSSLNLYDYYDYYGRAGYPVKIRGKDLILGNGISIKGEGEVVLENEGYLIKDRKTILDFSGDFQVDMSQQSIFSQQGDLLISDNEKPSLYEGNYIYKESKNNYKINSEDLLVLEALPGSALFNTFTKDSRGKTIPNINSFLRIAASRAELTLSKDSTKNTFPTITQNAISTPGFISIDNGRSTMLFDSTKLKILYTEEANKQNRNQQSVPLIIRSPIFGKETNEEGVYNKELIFTDEKSHFRLRKGEEEKVEFNYFSTGM